MKNFSAVTEKLENKIRQRNSLSTHACSHVLYWNDSYTVGVFTIVFVPMGENSNEKRMLL